MRPRSIASPLLLIALGVLLLTRNIWPELPLLELVSRYWALLLVVWGGVRLAEVLFWHVAGRPLPAYAVSGAEWTVIALICLSGSALAWGMKRPWSNLRISGKALEVFGDTFEFPVKQSRVVGRSPRIVLELGRGNAKVVGADTELISITGRKTIRAYEQSDANQADEASPLEVVSAGDVVTIRTNQERLSASSRASTDLEITIPRGASFEGRGRSGDFDVRDLQGEVRINSDNAGVRLQNLASNARVELRRSDIVRATAVKGGIQIRGRGQDIDLDTIEGPVTIEGSYTGELTFRALAKPLRFQGTHTEMRVERISGSVRLQPGSLMLENVTGPTMVRGRTRDVLVREFSGDLDVEVNNGDVELQPAAGFGKVEVKTGTGDIRLIVPPAARFELRAQTERGEIRNHLGAGYQSEKESKGAKASGGSGGPLISLSTERGEIVLRKGGLPEKSPAVVEENR